MREQETHPGNSMTTEELNLAIRDSIQMEGAKTFRELEYVCRNIEARHRVEGISEPERVVYEAEKRRNVLRVMRAVNA